MTTQLNSNQQNTMQNDDTEMSSTSIRAEKNISFVRFLLDDVLRRVDLSITQNCSNKDELNKDILTVVTDKNDRCSTEAVIIPDEIEKTDSNIDTSTNISDDEDLLLDLQFNFDEMSPVKKCSKDNNSESSKEICYNILNDVINSLDLKSSESNIKSRSLISTKKDECLNELTKSNNNSFVNEKSSNVPNSVTNSCNCSNISKKSLSKTESSKTHSTLVSDIKSSALDVFIDNSSFTESNSKNENVVTEFQQGGSLLVINDNNLIEPSIIENNALSTSINVEDSNSKESPNISSSTSFSKDIYKTSENSMLENCIQKTELNEEIKKVFVNISDNKPAASCSNISKESNLFQPNNFKGKEKNLVELPSNVNVTETKDDDTSKIQNKNDKSNSNAHEVTDSVRISFPENGKNQIISTQKCSTSLTTKNVEVSSVGESVKKGNNELSNLMCVQNKMNNHSKNIQTKYLKKCETTSSSLNIESENIVTSNDIGMEMDKYLSNIESEYLEDIGSNNSSKNDIDSEVTASDNSIKEQVPNIIENIVVGIKFENNDEEKKLEDIIEMHSSIIKTEPEDDFYETNITVENQTELSSWNEGVNTSVENIQVNAEDVKIEINDTEESNCDPLVESDEIDKNVDNDGGLINDKTDEISSPVKIKLPLPKRKYNNQNRQILSKRNQSLRIMATKLKEASQKSIEIASKSKSLKNVKNRTSLAQKKSNNVLARPNNNLPLILQRKKNSRKFNSVIECGYNTEIVALKKVIDSSLTKVQNFDILESENRKKISIKTTSNASSSTMPDTVLETRGLQVLRIPKFTPTSSSTLVPVIDGKMAPTITLKKSERQTLRHSASIVSCVLIDKSTQATLGDIKNDNLLLGESIRFGSAVRWQKNKSYSPSGAPQWLEDSIKSRKRVSAICKTKEGITHRPVQTSVVDLFSSVKLKKPMCVSCKIPPVKTSPTQIQLPNSSCQLLSVPNHVQDKFKCQLPQKQTPSPKHNNNAAGPSVVYVNDPFTMKKFNSNEGPELNNSKIQLKSMENAIQTTFSKTSGMKSQMTSYNVVNTLATSGGNVQLINTAQNNDVLYTLPSGVTISTTLKTSSLNKNKEIQQNKIEELEAINRLKRLGTVVRVEDQKKNNPPPNLIPLAGSNNNNNVTGNTLVESIVASQNAKVLGYKGQTEKNSSDADDPIFVNNDLSVFSTKCSFNEENLEIHFADSNDNSDFDSDNMDNFYLEPVVNIVEDNIDIDKNGYFQLKVEQLRVKGQFVCDICSKSYHHMILISKHYYRLHISRKFISETSKKAYAIPESEDNGDNAVDDSHKVFRCHICNKLFETKLELKEDLDKHIDKGKEFQCKTCGELFKFKKLFARHKRMCFSFEEMVGTPQFHCLYCNESFYSSFSKKNHVLSLHPYLRRTHVCVFCAKTFSTNAELFSHLLNEHPTEYFACRLCKERFLNINDFQTHISVKHEPNINKDSDGNVTTIANSNNTDDKLYNCFICRRVFIFEKDLKDHNIKVHNMICSKELKDNVIQVNNAQPKANPVEDQSKIIKKQIKAVRARNGVTLQGKTHERLVVHHSKHVDPETLFYSQVADNVRNNLENYLDGKLNNAVEEIVDETIVNVEQQEREILNFSSGFSSMNVSVTDDQETSECSTSRQKSQWEKFNFPKHYDGCCGLTQYIKDASLLDIATQLIMRRNLQRLSLLAHKEANNEDVPSILSLERSEDIDTNEDPSKQLLGEFSGEWVRKRKYVCSVCLWETTSLWKIEDHKFEVHPRIYCPQHELMGEDRLHLSRMIYKRLVDLDPPFESVKKAIANVPDKMTCTKCFRSDFVNASDLHNHIFECAGQFDSGQYFLRSAKKNVTPLLQIKYHGRRRGMRRCAPNTPPRAQLVPRIRTKPGDSDTIQKMLANLPAKRPTKRVIGFDDDVKTRSQSTIQNSQPIIVTPLKSKAKNRSSSHHLTPIMKINYNSKNNSSCVQKSSQFFKIKKETDYIDTSAEHGTVLANLHMMPVKKKTENTECTTITSTTTISITSTSITTTSSNTNSNNYVSTTSTSFNTNVSKTYCKLCLIGFVNKQELLNHPCNSDKVMPQLEKEVVQTSNTNNYSNNEIPVLSPVDSKDSEVVEININDTTVAVNENEDNLNITKKRKRKGKVTNLLDDTSATVEKNSSLEKTEIESEKVLSKPGRRTKKVEEYVRSTSRSVSVNKNWDQLYDDLDKVGREKRQRRLKQKIANKEINNFEVNEYENTSENKNNIQLISSEEMTKVPISNDQSVSVMKIECEQIDEVVIKKEIDIDNCNDVKEEANFSSTSITNSSNMTPTINSVDEKLVKTEISTKESVVIKRRKKSRIFHKKKKYNYIKKKKFVINELSNNREDSNEINKETSINKDLKESSTSSENTTNIILKVPEIKKRGRPIRIKKTSNNNNTAINSKQVLNVPTRRRLRNKFQENTNNDVQPETLQNEEIPITNTESDEKIKMNISETTDTAMNSIVQSECISSTSTTTDITTDNSEIKQLDNDEDINESSKTSEIKRITRSKLSHKENIVNKNKMIVNREFENNKVDKNDLEKQTLISTELEQNLEVTCNNKDVISDLTNNEKDEITLLDKTLEQEKMSNSDGNDTKTVAEDLLHLEREQAQNENLDKSNDTIESSSIIMEIKPVDTIVNDNQIVETVTKDKSYDEKESFDKQEKIDDSFENRTVDQDEIINNNEIILDDGKVNKEENDQSVNTKIITKRGRKKLKLIVVKKDHENLNTEISAEIEKSPNKSSDLKFQQNVLSTISVNDVSENPLTDLPVVSKVIVKDNINNEDELNKNQNVDSQEKFEEIKIKSKELTDISVNLSPMPRKRGRPPKLSNSESSTSPDGKGLKRKNGKELNESSNKKFKSSGNDILDSSTQKDLINHCDEVIADVVRNSMIISSDEDTLTNLKNNKYKRNSEKKKTTSINDQVVESSQNSKKGEATKMNDSSLETNQISIETRINESVIIENNQNTTNCESINKSLTVGSSQNNEEADLNESVEFSQNSKKTKKTAKNKSISVRSSQHSGKSDATEINEFDAIKSNQSIENEELNTLNELTSVKRNKGRKKRKPIEINGSSISSEKNDVTGIDDLRTNESNESIKNEELNTVNESNYTRPSKGRRKRKTIEINESSISIKSNSENNTSSGVDELLSDQTNLSGNDEKLNIINESTNVGPSKTKRKRKAAEISESPISDNSNELNEKKNATGLNELLPVESNESFKNEELNTLNKSTYVGSTKSRKKRKTTEMNESSISIKSSQNSNTNKLNDINKQAAVSESVDNQISEVNSQEENETVQKDVANVQGENSRLGKSCFIKKKMNKGQIKKRKFISKVSLSETKRRKPNRKNNSKKKIEQKQYKKCLRSSIGSVKQKSSNIEPPINSEELSEKACEVESNVNSSNCAEDSKVIVEDKGTSKFVDLQLDFSSTASSPKDLEERKKIEGLLKDLEGDVDITEENIIDSHFDVEKELEKLHNSVEDDQNTAEANISEDNDVVVDNIRTKKYKTKNKLPKDIAEQNIDEIQSKNEVFNENDKKPIKLTRSVKKAKKKFVDNQLETFHENMEEKIKLRHHRNEIKDDKSLKMDEETESDSSIKSGSSTNSSIKRLKKSTKLKLLRKKILMKKVKRELMKWQVSNLEENTELGVDIKLEDEKQQPVNNEKNVDIISDSTIIDESNNINKPVVACETSYNVIQQSTSNENQHLWINNPTNLRSNIEESTLGSILQSVNNILNEPETSSYNSENDLTLRELQEAIGATNDEMLLFQQTLNEEWNKEYLNEDNNTSLIDLDTQNLNKIGSKTSKKMNWSKSYDSSQNSSSDETIDYAAITRLTAPRPSNLTTFLQDHEEKHFICPDCKKYFKGYNSLQLHLKLVHFSENSLLANQNNNQPGEISNINEKYLICYICQKNLSSNSIASHMILEHDLNDYDITRCVEVNAFSSTGLKSKMTSALEDLLGRAYNKTIAPNSDVSGGKQWTSKSIKIHLPSKINEFARDLLLNKLSNRSVLETDRLSNRSFSISALTSRTKPSTSSDPTNKNYHLFYSCTFCGLMFNDELLRNNHVATAHVKAKKEEESDFDYEDDWRDIPSPNSENSNSSFGNTLICSDCGLGSNSLAELNEHRTKMHASSKISIMEQFSNFSPASSVRRLSCDSSGSQRSKSSKSSSVKNNSSSSTCETEIRLRTGRGKKRLSSFVLETFDAEKRRNAEVALRKLQKRANLLAAASTSEGKSPGNLNLVLDDVPTDKPTSSNMETIMTRGRSLNSSATLKSNEEKTNKRYRFFKNKNK